MVVTLPLGYNSFLDDFFSGNDLGFTALGYLKRISRDNRWRQVSYDDVRGIRYGDPFMCANAVAVGTYVNSGGD